MGEFKRMSDVVIAGASKYDSKTAMIDERRQWSYGELNGRVAEFSAFLRDSGVEEGDRVGLFLDNSCNFLLAMISIPIVSGVLTPVPIDLPAERTGKLLSQARPRFVLTDCPARLQELVDSPVTRFVAPDSCAGVDSLELFQLGDGQKESTNHAYIAYLETEDDDAFHSVAVSHRDLAGYVAAIQDAHKFNPSSHLLATLPFSSDDSFGPLLAALAAGATVESAACKTFTPECVARRLSDGDITHLSASVDVFEAAAEIVCAGDTGRQLKLGSIHLADGECLEDLRRRFRVRVPNNRVHFNAAPSRNARSSERPVHLSDEFAALNIITEYISYFAKYSEMSVAIKGEDHSLSYGELESHVNSFAYFLESLGFTRNDRIAIYLENSIEYAVAIFGAFKKSCLYVPIPHNDPRERMVEILQDCKPKMVISRKKDDVYKLADPAVTTYVVFVDADADEELPELENGMKAFSLKKCIQEKKTIADPNRDPKSLAYIIYTSGSTGKPKGVTIRHESLMNYVREAVVEFDFDNQTNAMSESPYHFDGSFSALFAPMYVGGANVIFKNRFMLPREFILMLIKNKVTHLSCVPSFFAVLVENATPDATPYIRLKTVALGGEDCQLDHIKRLKQMIPKVRIYNQYGPTETCDVICGFEIGMEFIASNKKVPIGKPYKKVSMYALKEDFTPIGLNEVGELYLGGTQVMECYWNDPVLSGGKLKRDILPGKLLYKTGDLVTITEDGDYVFIDRADNMINKYGNRIYLSEIENTLLELPSVKEALCLFIKEREAADIVAFVTLNENLSRQQLRDVVKSKLPEYMIPNHFMILDAIPYLSNGKVDRNKLQKSYLDEIGDGNRKPPSAGGNGHFDRITGIIGSISTVEQCELDGQVNLAETFGFDSMMLLRLIMEIEKEYEILFKPEEVDLENFLTIDRITALLEGRGR